MTDLPAGWSMPDSGTQSPPSERPAPDQTGYAAAAGFRRGLLPLRPMATGEVLDGAVAVTRAFPRTVLAFGAVLAVISSVLDLIITLSLLGPVSTTTDELASGSDSANQLIGGAALGTGLNILVGIVTGAVMAGVMTAVVGRAVFGQGTTLSQAWAELRPRVWLLLGLSLLVGIAVYGSFFVGVALFALLAQAGSGGAVLGLLLAAAGSAAAVWLYVRWSLASAALVLEKAGVRAALKRSAVLVNRSFWRVLGILLLALVISLTVALVVQLPFQLLGYDAFASFDSNYELTTTDAVIGSIAGALASTLVAPFSAGVRALLYVDRRMRAEGLDVALVAAAQGR